MEWFLKSRVLKIAGREQFNVSRLATLVRRAYYNARVMKQRFPTSPSALKESELYKSWWYYSVELLPGIMKTGIFPDDFPMLPRILMRNCILANADCLDLGSMEGLIPVLLARQGAKSVLATDASFHCYEKMAALKHYYNVNFNFQQIGSMYQLSDKLKSHGGFDFINLSGVLYHVFSPMHVLAGVRPLLKKNGLMIVSTNVINRPDFSMEFNDQGKLQTEGNTFWYPSVPLLEYMLRYFRLRPIDYLYYRYPAKDSVRYNDSFDAGYLSVLCRASDNAPLEDQDEWGIRSAKGSWEISLLCDLDMLLQQSVSAIQYRGELDQRFLSVDKESIDLFEALHRSDPVGSAERAQDAHCLSLSDEV